MNLLLLTAAAGAAWLPVAVAQVRRAASAACSVQLRSHPLLRAHSLTHSSPFPLPQPPSSCGDADKLQLRVLPAASAAAWGAACLDGTPPAYWLSVRNASRGAPWMIQLEGGAWYVRALARASVLCAACAREAPRASRHGTVSLLLPLVRARASPRCAASAAAGAGLSMARRAATRSRAAGRVRSPTWARRAACRRRRARAASRPATWRSTPPSRASTRPFCTTATAAS